MKAKRGSWKAVPKITPFERRNAIEVGEIVEMGSNPLGVTVHSAEGSYTYSYKDIAHCYERNHRPFSQTVSLFIMKDGKNANDYKRKAIC